jgi:hypothetical protein
MNADEARKISNGVAAPTNEVVVKWVEYFFKEILKAANKGQHSVELFCAAGNMPVTTQKELKAIERELLNAGFRLVDYPDPDPDNFFSGPYTMIEW